MEYDKELLGELWRALTRANCQVPVDMVGFSDIDTFLYRYYHIYITDPESVLIQGATYFLSQKGNS